MKANDLFIHPVTNKKCAVTRYYGENAWYYRELYTEPEIRAMTAASQITIIAPDEGQYVKLNLDAIRKSPWNYTQKFLDFIEGAKDQVFAVDDIIVNKVYLKDVPYTFWIGHIIFVQ